MESIDRLFAILGSAMPGDTIARITASPWTWFLLLTGVDECWYVYWGLPEHVRMESPVGIRILVDQTQMEDFCLWDHEGRMLEAIVEE